jgi:prophage regulatory protein
MDAYQIQNLPTGPLMKLSEVMAATTYSSSQIYRMMKDGTFPAQLHLGPNRVAWRTSDIADWLASRS